MTSAKHSSHEAAAAVLRGHSPPVSLLVAWCGGWGWPVHTGPQGVHEPHGDNLRIAAPW